MSGWGRVEADFYNMERGGVAWVVQSRHPSMHLPWLADMGKGWLPRAPVLGVVSPVPLEPAPWFPGAVCGAAGDCKEVGACLAAGTHQTTGKCQCLPGHLSPSACSHPPSAYHRRARNSLQHEGTEPGREGRQSPILLLFIPISFLAPVRWTNCQVHEVCCMATECGCFVEP